jgi:hypothetical protein
MAVGPCHPVAQPMQNNSNISLGRVNIPLPGKRQITLTTQETRQELVRGGEFGVSQIIDLTKSTTLPGNLNLTNQDLYLNPEAKTTSERVTGSLVDTHSSNLSGSNRKEEQSKYQVRVLEAQKLLAEYEAILIHCNNGRTRTPAVAAIVIALETGQTFREALKVAVLAYRTQRSGLEQICGLDVDKFIQGEQVNVDYLMLHGKLVDLAEKVWQDLKKAAKGVKAASQATGTEEFEPIALRTRSKLNLVNVTLRSLLEESGYYK